MKRCLLCETEIPGNSRRRKFCSDKCSNKDRNNRNHPPPVYVDKPCANCGEMFTPKYSASHTCGSKECLANRLLVLERRRYAELDKKLRFDVVQKELITTKCPRCERLYQRIFIPAWIGRGMPRMQCEVCKHSGMEQHWGGNEARI
jgi:hypothetical protein